MNIQRRAAWRKCRLTITINRDKSQPYGHQPLKVVNRILRIDAPDLGNCNWGELQFLCWYHQYEQLCIELERAGRKDFADAITLEILDVWPRFPINCTGESLIGGYEDISMPPEYARLKKENQMLRQGLQGVAKGVARLEAKLEENSNG